ncbi:hypothetical protein [Paenibacillus sp. MMS18-CY102]|uniref:hypothetical protein n=1 Tax=Paenibacillus sp. MMS18-CY102 TaxID=2682849 RepID=UPI00136618A1|nr:hypothetical protein [Paenibacillus sp. MMS18-CY102]MWC29203.1 hypothetical protein [Paenibacillus sp. MMS18-CY102]
MINKITESKVVIDNTTLSNFSLADNLHLLNEVFQGNKIITVAVKLESFEKGKVKRDVSEAISSGWLEVHELHGVLMLAEYYAISKKHSMVSSEGFPKLGDGEAASVVYAKHMGYALITDDNGPKKLAQSLGITTLGTIGILYIAQQKGILSIPTCNLLFSEMKCNGAYFPKKYQMYNDCISDLESKFMLRKHQ